MNITEFKTKVKDLITELEKSQGVLLSEMDVISKINNSATAGKHKVGFDIVLKFE